MSNPHLILCGGAKLHSRQQYWRNAKTIELRIGRAGSEDSNVNLRISDLTDRLTANLRDIELDLLEIATYIYCADQASTRGGDREIDYGEAWYRDFRFEIAVRRPDFWSSDEVVADLVRCLTDLSGDNFEFQFSQVRTASRHKEYFEFAEEDAAEVEEVMLFSGGLDSLGGSVQEILAKGRKVALVSHRANPKIDNRQKRLVTDLSALVTDRKHAPLHVPVLVNKAKELNKEYTQRTRSFLFASIAALVARLFRLKRIRFYENGVTSLNLPVSPQILSTRATRSTHPKPLAGMCALFSRLFQDGFGIENPFFWKTKTDVLVGIKEAGHAKLCASSVSCAHTWEMTNDHPHCGKCSQCVDRRLAALAAGFTNDEDSPDGYKFNLFKDALTEDSDRILVESIVETINRIDRCDTALKFCLEFSELNRVLNYVRAPADDTARAIYDLYRRHASQIGKVLDDQGRAAFPQLRRGELPESCLVGIMGSGLRRSSALPPKPAEKSGTPATDQPSQEVASCGFEIDHGKFSIVAKDRSPLVLGNRKEFHLLAALAEAPDNYVPHSELAHRLGGDELNSVTHVKSRLVKQLTLGGYGDVAARILSARGHYGLFLS